MAKARSKEQLEQLYILAEQLLIANAYLRGGAARVLNEGPKIVLRMKRAGFSHRAERRVLRFLASVLMSGNMTHVSSTALVLKSNLARLLACKSTEVQIAGDGESVSINAAQ